MSRPSRSLARRVVWAVTGTVAVFLASLAAAAYFVLAEQEDALVNEVLATETLRLIQRLEAGEASSPGHGALQLGPDMRAWVGEGAPQLEGLPTALRGLAPGLHELYAEDSVWHLAVADSAVGRVHVLYDATRHEQRVYDFGQLLFALWLAGAILAYVLARVLARQVMAPLYQLTERLARWGPGAPGASEPESIYQDEAGRLLEAFNRVQDQVDQALASEREFAMNLSHEIRTPLTAIRTDAEMAALGTNLSPAQGARLQRIMQGIDDISEVISSVQELGADGENNAEVVPVAQAVDDVWASLGERAQAAGLDLVNAVPVGLALTLDRRAFITVVRNLMANAIEHAAPATLTVSQAVDGLEFADNGPGIAAADLPFVFDRYYRGHRRDAGLATDGSPDFMHRRGLGLAIARRSCLLHGWQLEAESSTSGPARGTRFILSIPDSTLP